MAKDRQRVVRLFFALLWAGQSQLACAGAPVPALPKEWRLPLESELTLHDWRAKSSNHYTQADGDFDGDGLNDKALLVVRKSDFANGLLIFLTSSSKWLTVDLIRDGLDPLKYGLAMGLEICQANPNGRYYPGEIDESEGRKLLRELQAERRPAICYFREGSSGSYLVWDKKRSKFVQIGYSD